MSNVVTYTVMAVVTTATDSGYGIPEILSALISPPLQNGSPNPAVPTISAGFAAWFLTLPIVLPGLPGLPWNNGNTLAFS